MQRLPDQDGRPDQVVAEEMVRLQPQQAFVLVSFIGPGGQETEGWDVLCGDTGRLHRPPQTEQESQPSVDILREDYKQSLLSGGALTGNHENMDGRHSDGCRGLQGISKVTERKGNKLVEIISFIRIPRYVREVDVVEV